MLSSLRICPPYIIVLALVVVGMVAGCNSRAKNKVVPVQGRIAFHDGKTLPEGTRLIFNPVEGGTGSASGVTAADGSFQLTHVSGSRGAELGKYTIVLAAPGGDPGTFSKIVPKEYLEGGTLSVEVLEGIPALDFKVKRRK